jgi:hypothetical protein
MPLIDQLNGGRGCGQPRIVMDTCSDLCMAKKFLCDMLSGATMKNSETTGQAAGIRVLLFQRVGVA